LHDHSANATLGQEKTLSVSPYPSITAILSFKSHIVQVLRERRFPLRFVGKNKMGFYPLPLSEAHRIRKFIQFPGTSSSALDPCVGDGAAFEVITNGAEVFRYGIELDAYRADQARQRISNIVQGNTLEVQCPVECFGLLYLNPPYDWTLGPADSRRTEQSFLSHTYRWLKPGGVLIFVIPGDRLAECSQILSTHFRDVRVYRLDSLECVRYKQVVVIGARRSRREKERLTESDITRARLYYASLARNSSQIPVLPSEPEARYHVPASGPAQLVYRGLPLDEIEDLLPQSAGYRQAGRILFAEPVSATGRPLTPLHSGHVGLLACSGLLNGIFGSNDQQHITFWQAVKVIDKTEEEEDGVITVREKERFSNELTVVYSTGQVAILK
jgi:SAM-dependent methyltransferase